MTPEQITAAARALNKRHAELCNVNEADSWAIQGEDFIADARAALNAAQAAAQAPREVPRLTDEGAKRVVINACDSLNITRVHELGGKTRTICDEAGLLEIARAVESRVREMCGVAP